MKVITAKEFQLRQSEVMHEVAQGVIYEVTYHGRPWVELRPKVDGRAFMPGSPEAVRASFDVTLSSRNLPSAPDYKRLRRDRLTARQDS